MSKAAERFATGLRRCMDVPAESTRQCVEVMYNLFTELIKGLANDLGTPEARYAKRSGYWNVEMLDEAIDKIADAYWSISHTLIESWDNLWELYLTKEPEASEVTDLYRELERLAQELLSNRPSQRSRGSKYRARGRE
ncbi:MAG: hypothetical protein DRO39_02705 [Thermoprotei archaeon]|nr:MAG: hypothetical protein DRO39_02705 [Thermoprotei archaeon]